MAAEIITSASNPRIKELARLPKDGRFLVEGFHLVEMAISAGAAEEIFTVKPYESKVRTTLVSPSVMDKICLSKTPEGIAAVCHLPDVHASTNRILLLDAVQDPGNVGTILRTALSFGFLRVYLGRGCADAANSKTIQASQGALFKLEIVRSADLVETARELKKAGFLLVGTDLKGAGKAESLPKEKGIALVLGNEGQGVAPSLLEECDERIRIPMSGIDSLNVSVAGGILMYLLRA